MQKCEEIREDSQKKTSGNENRFKCPLLQQSYESPCWERGFLRQLICITSRANEPPKGHAKRRNVLHLTMTSLLLSLKLTASTWKWMVRIMLVSLWGKKPIFRGEAVSFRESIFILHRFVTSTRTRCHGTLLTKISGKQQKHFEPKKWKWMGSNDFPFFNYLTFRFQPLPSLKLTANAPRNGWLEDWISFWDGLISWVKWQLHSRSWT